MKILVIILINLIVGTFLVRGQNSYMIEYAKKPEISDKQGIPNNISSYYFPVIVGTDTLTYFRVDGDIRILPLKYKDEIIAILGQDSIIDSLQYHAIDDFSLQYYSRYMYELDEPILFNYYHEKDIVRLTCFSSILPPSMIKIEKKDDQILVHKKHLNNYIENLYIDNQEEYRNAINSKEKQLEIIVDTVFSLHEEQFTKLIKLIDSTKITNLIPYANIEYGLDGADWILEIHTKRGYYYIKRWNIKYTPSFQEIVDYVETMCQ